MKRQPELQKLFSDMVPLGRVATMDEIKGLALLLAFAGGRLYHRGGDPDRRRSDLRLDRGDYTTLARSIEV